MDATSAPQPSDPPEILPPELAGQYEVVRELGRGAMGVVYLARNKLMNRLEALKVLNTAMLERRGMLERFLREIRVVAQLGHENVVRAFSALQLGRSIVLVLEYVEGIDLARLVKQKGPLPVPHACYFVHQAALGLQHAHERGMVHRDIKPGNLILHKEGQRAIVKVLDFGLAKALSEQAVDGSLTHEGQMLGTPDYIAPEQTLDPQKADIRADIYSLGCTLYFLLTGGPPFRGTSIYDILRAHHASQAQPLDRVRPEVPPALAAVVATMMAKEPERRYQTPAEAARALVPYFRKRGAVGEVTIPIAKPPPSPRPPSDAPAGPEPQWQSLIEFKDTDLPTAPIRPRGRAPRRRGPLIAAATALGVVGLGVALLSALRDPLAGNRAPGETGRPAETRPNVARPSPSPSPSPSSPSPPPAADLVRPGSIWTEPGGGRTLTVLGRAGDAFTARYVAGTHEREIRGTIRGGAIAWRAGDSKVIRGSPGHDVRGTVHGGEMSLEWDEGLLHGTFTLRIRPSPETSTGKRRRAGDRGAVGLR